MPPKKKGKGKKGKGKGKKKAAEPEPEVDKSFYELQITVLNHTLSDLRSRQLIVEKRNEDLLLAKNALREDEADIVFYLNRTIQERQDDMTKLQEESDQVEAERAATVQAFEDAKQNLMNNYRMIEDQLNADLNLIVGKMHALEEFRLQRDELMHKYELMENALEEQKIRHKREIYEVERKFIIGKDKLKKEMDAKLKWLIEQFQSVTDLRVAATTLHVLRENIALNNKLSDMLKHLRQLHAEHEAVNARKQKSKLLAQLVAEEAVTISDNVYNSQSQITSLVNDYFAMQNKIKAGLAMEPVLNQLLAEKQERLQMIEDYKGNVVILEQHLHEYRCQREFVDTHIREENKRSQDLIEFLTNASSIIDSARFADSYSLYEVMPEGGPEHRSKSSMLHTLHEYLMQVREWHRRPLVTVVRERREDIYMKGKLGLVPRVIPIGSPPAMRNRNVEAEFPSFSDLGMDEEEEEAEEEFEPIDTDFMDAAESMLSVAENETQTIEEGSTTDSSDLDVD